jgi:hypothetical protein
MTKFLICFWVIFSFLSTSILPPSVFAQTPSIDPTGLPFYLPKPGSRVNLSPAFQPALIKGLKVHPENPFLFDFIVDPGDEKLSADDFKKISQRMVNYFLASLATPEQDLWVNLSPVEKNHIIPDTLVKTELGRDLLAEDYMLKQVGASLIYPDSSFGKAFWDKVYSETRQKFAAAQIPMDVFNKIWILPEKASVFEKGSAVFIVNAHLKVMLEEDYLASKLLGKKSGRQTSSIPVKNISKQVLREIVVPLIEKEVNEGKNFAKLRQVFYALILAQWYEEVFKESILNKDYSGQKKMAGIDVSDPRNKDRIYRQYLSAYKKGVFNYIREETDHFSHQPVPRKYFSGGFVGRHVNLAMASASDVNLAMMSDQGARDVRVDLALTSEIEPREQWNDLNKPLVILKELEGLYRDGSFDRKGLYAFIDKYKAQVEAPEQILYPVQRAWPVLKAVALLEKAQEQDLVAALREKYAKGDRPDMVDKILLMNNIFDKNKWVKESTPALVDRTIYLVAAEAHHWAGGLGPVMKFHGKGMKDLGADVAYIEPWYEYQLKREQGQVRLEELNYESQDIGLKEVDYKSDEFDVMVGDNKVHVKVASGIDQNGIRVYMFRDVAHNEHSIYTKMLYNYWKPDLNIPKEVYFNPITQEESMAFINVASAELLLRLETKRRQQQGDKWKAAVVHANDGQYGPLEAVTLSRYGSEDVIKKIFWAFTTHTFLNRGGSKDIDGTINGFLRLMMAIKNRFINAFRHKDSIDYTSGGLRLANWAGGVSDKHRDKVSKNDPNVNLMSVTNGSVPEEMAEIFREEFIKLFPDGDFERPTATQLDLVKRAGKKRINEGPEADRIKAANGAYVHLDLDRPLIGYARRLVREKAGRERAFSNDNIWKLVELGYNVVLMGNHQGTAPSEEIASGLRALEKEIAAEKAKDSQKFPGGFQFVESFTPYQKKLFLAACDVQVQDSDENTGAAEFSEEDITANGGLQAGPTYREGVIIDQGIPLDFEHPGRGQTLMPKQDTSSSWLETVYGPLMELWQKSSEHTEFYEYAANSPRLNRIQRYLITSAAYLREYNRILKLQEKWDREDFETEMDIRNALRSHPEIIKDILYNGRNEVRNFEFEVEGVGEHFWAYNAGLDGFYRRKKELEDIYGHDAFLKYLFQESYYEYLIKLFENSPAEQLVKDYIENMKKDKIASATEKEKRLALFFDNLRSAFKTQLNHTASPAMIVAEPGGIKFEHIDMLRQGRLTVDVVNSKALEGALLRAQGLYGIIEEITPIPNLLDFYSIQ